MIAFITHTAATPEMDSRVRKASIRRGPFGRGIEVKPVSFSAPSVVSVRGIVATNFAGDHRASYEAFAQALEALAQVGC